MILLDLRMHGAEIIGAYGWARRCGVVRKGMIVVAVMIPG